MRNHVLASGNHWIMVHQSFVLDLNKISLEKIDGVLDRSKNGEKIGPPPPGPGVQIFIVRLSIVDLI